MSEMSIADMRELIKLKRENPAEYEKTINDMVEIGMDFARVSAKKAKEIMKMLKAAEDENDV